MTTLADLVTVSSAFSRSANVERDAATDALHGYIPTARGLDVTRRLTRALTDPRAVRAWSLTGPYGSGKSSLALFLHALVGPAGDARSYADQLLSDADPDLAVAFTAARAEADAHGFVRATATAQREPARATILRALTTGAAERWRTVPKAVRTALAEADAKDDARSVVAALEAVAAHAPVLLLLDEFGKNLEHFADAPEDADLFLLQEIAERASGASGVPIYLFTLQHLAFENYATQAAPTQRREWAKIQGRFEDVPFVEAPAESSRLIAGALKWSDSTTPEWREQTRQWADDASAAAAKAGLPEVAGGDVERLAHCYPLHPVALLVTPELCARYGQNGRTLFTFLASEEPLSVRTFLRETVADLRRPTIRLDRVYDYFVESAGTMVGASAEASRWLEIDTRIREAHGLSDEDCAILKTVGLLNLVARGGALRASAGMIAFACCDIGDNKARARVARRLKVLERDGLLTYRAFADEYRIWQGTDFDLEKALDAAREDLRGTSVAELLNDIADRRPVVAARHSQTVGMLRYFDVVFADEHTTALPIPPAEVAADGLLVLMLGEALPDALRPPVGTKPVVTAASACAGLLASAALELLSLRRVLDDPGAVPAGDWVARRELQEREAAARQHAEQAIRDVFGQTAADLRWTLATDTTGMALTPKRSRSAVLSDVCDLVYAARPVLGSEMLGRHEVTSQGAKARRMLLEAMAEREELPRLGLEGYGPERSLYASVLERSGLHVDGVDGWHFPRRLSHDPRHFAPAWDALHAALDSATEQPVSAAELFNQLALPPYGVKRGALPVIIAAALFARRDDVAVFQDGVYQPALAADVLERMVKMPERFTMRRLDLAGQHGVVLEQLALALNRRYTGTQPARRRNGSAVAITAALLQQVRALPDYSRNTRHAAPEAVGVRSALLGAEDPAALLFHDLPVACGIDPADLSTEAGARDYALTLALHLRELATAYNQMIEQVGAVVSSARGASTVVDLRETYGAAADRLAAKSGDASVRSFLFAVGNQHLDEDEWLENLALAVSGKPPRTWRDSDVAAFSTRVVELAGQWQRLEALDLAAAGPDARRIVVTQPDGTEDVAVTHVTADMLEATREAAADVLESLRSQLGFDPTAALATLLASQLASPTVSGITQPQETS